MTKAPNDRNSWKDMLIILVALAGGFLLSFFGFGLLWSGIPWHTQLIMILPFLLLTYGIYRWSNGAIGFCIFIIIGAAPLAMLIIQFRDTNGSHLMTILVVTGWLIGIFAGWYLGKLFRKPVSESPNNIASS